MRRLFAAAAVIAFALPAAAFAQANGAPALAPAPVPAEVTPVPAPPTTARPVARAMARADVAGIQRHEDATDTHTIDAAAASTGLHQGEGVALMVVGGAAMVGGLIVGGDAGTAIAIGGLAIGLVGLYQYVR